MLFAQLALSKVSGVESGNYLEIKLPESKVYLGVKEPHNWVGDLVKAPDYYAAALFYQNTKSFKSGGALIKVTVYKKIDENTLADIEYDMNKFSKNNQKAKFLPIEVTHSDYAAFGRLAYVERKYYEYVTYLNPGREFEAGILVRMELKNREATPTEWTIYEEIVRSTHLSPIEEQYKAENIPVQR